jgi:uncharacterized protein with von Willebrand factor type A (vWA) domain
MSGSSRAATLRAAGGRLTENIVRFARALRAGGVRVSTDRILLTLEALQTAGVESRDDFRAVLLACLIDRAEDRALFERAFRRFWMELEQLALPTALPPVQTNAPSASPVASLGSPPAAALEDLDPRTATHEAGMYLSASEQERLRKTDFDAMSSAEWRAAIELVSSLAPALPRSATRRFRPSNTGNRIDILRVLRDTARRGGEMIVVPRRTRRTRPTPLVALVDISGSMSRYSQTFLRFAHAIAQSARLAGGSMHAFVFGTRLTQITRQIDIRDPDAALARVAAAVDDWSGGTRIAACLKHFNKHWARRVGSQSATVLLLTDGLERADPEPLGRETAKLARSCRRLVWLNPLLRYDGFEPRAAGVRAMLPFADAVLPVHDVRSLERLAATVFADGRSRWK